MRKLMFILMCLFCGLSFGAMPSVCGSGKFIENTQIDDYSLVGLVRHAKYVQIDMKNGANCASILTPNYTSDGKITENAINHDGVWNGFFGFGRRVFSIKTHGQSFCIKNGSVWEVISSSATMKTAELTLKSVDSNLSELLYFSTYYESSVASARESSGLRPLSCVP